MPVMLPGGARQCERKVTGKNPRQCEGVASPEGQNRFCSKCCGLKGVQEILRKSQTSSAFTPLGPAQPNQFVSGIIPGSFAGGAQSAFPGAPPGYPQAIGQNPRATNIEVHILEQDPTG